jgi:formylglycine-generating enzyme required for sulfatase activity
MADVFLSYAHEDAGRASDVARVLGQLGWSVFWDRRTPAGSQWDQVLERELNASKCVVVLWSEYSVKSDWVKIEASYARKRQKLVPAQLDETEPPLEFHLVEAAQLQGWTVDAEHPEFLILKEGIERHVAPSRESPLDLPLAFPQLFAAPARPVPLAPARAMILHTVGPAKSSGTVRFRADAWNLPDEPLLGFVEVPAGAFTMGEEVAEDDRHSYLREPQHEVTLPRYYIARYEVTVAQFKAFAAATRIELDANALKGFDDHPVRNISWHEALAYASWLDLAVKNDERACSSKLRAILSSGGSSWRVTLPSEAEWEKAARGVDARVYPWGDEKIDSSRANYAASNKDAPTPVGSYPDGASPYGIFDMCGNVWEWTRSLWGADGDDTREDLSARRSLPVARAVRASALARIDPLLLLRSDPGCEHTSRRRSRS